MRTDQARTEKYRKKIRGLIIPGQKARFGTASGRQTWMETVAKSIVTDQINLVYYIIFAKELNKIKGIHKGENLITEVEILQDKWISRGLSETVLNQIKQAFNIVIPAPPVGQPFKLDISLLDGPDVLV